MNTIALFTSPLLAPVVNETMAIVQQIGLMNYFSHHKLEATQKEMKETSLIQSLLSQSLISAVGVKPGQKTLWTQCDDDLGLFTLDKDYTASVPNPPQKG